MSGGISFRRHADDTLFKPIFTLSFAAQWPWLPRRGLLLACCPCSLNGAAAGQRQLARAAGITDHNNTTL